LENEREREREREREGEGERERERGVTKGWMNARGKSLCHPLLQNRSVVGTCEKGWLLHELEGKKAKTKKAKKIAKRIGT
jgi:hypothetical protein